MRTLAQQKESIEETQLKLIYQNIDNILKDQNIKQVLNPNTNKTVKYYLNSGFTLKEAYALSLFLTLNLYTKL